MYYYNARWYDPSLGRFIGRPLGADTLVPNPADAQAFDRYAYVLNNPLKYRDPSGHTGVVAVHDRNDGAIASNGRPRQGRICFRNYSIS